MKKLFAYCGKIGSGKAYCMLKNVEELKTTGNSIYLTSFADPLKQILRNSFGITKEGVVPCKVAPDQLSDIYIKGQIVDSIYQSIKLLMYFQPQGKAFEQFSKNTELQIKEMIGHNYDKFPDFPEHVRYAANFIEFARNYRRAAQLIGTELGRFILDSIWVDLAIYRVEQSFKDGHTDYAFIDDCRFVNEYEAIVNFGKGKYKSEVIGILATDETRATRRNLSLEAVKEEGMHGSETEIDTIINMLPIESIIDNN
jgi:hypothetical protein